VLGGFSFRHRNGLKATAPLRSPSVARRYRLRGAPVAPSRARRPFVPAPQRLESNRAAALAERGSAAFGSGTAPA